MLLKARRVFPISSPPIENGVVDIEGDKIVSVGTSPSRAPAIDLGDACLLPGLVNAHAHLEFAAPPPTVAPSFAQWARAMASAVRDDPAPRIRRLLETGTTTVADHCGPDTPSFNAPFRRIPYWEVVGAGKDRAELSLERAFERSLKEGGQATPHSLYGVNGAVLEKLWGRPLSLHFLESADEDRCLRSGTGPLADYVKEREGTVVPIPLLPLLSRLVPGTLLIHGNFIENDEISLLISRGVTVIHCPGSHRFFGHRRFPFEELKRNGIPVALGTDSLASNSDLSMLREMRLFREAYPNVPVEEILRMATLEGASALGMEKEIGSIEAGKKADLVAVPGTDVLKAERVVFSMIDGEVCLKA